MGPKDLDELLNKRPFGAFRIHMTNDLVFDIRHPDQCTVGGYSARIVVPNDPLFSEDMRGKTVICSLVHITHIIELDES